MNKKLGLLAALLAFAVAPSTAFTATDTENVNVDAVFIQGITLTSTNSGLDFGITVLDGVASGFLTIDPTTTLSPAATTSPSVLANSGVQAAEFTVFTAPNETYSVTLPVSVSVPCVLGPCAGGNVLVDQFMFYSATLGGVPLVSGLNGLTDGTGNDVLRVGATLLFDKAQLGTYNSNVNVSVNFP